MSNSSIYKPSSVQLIFTCVFHIVLIPSMPPNSKLKRKLFRDVASDVLPSLAVSLSLAACCLSWSCHPSLLVASCSLAISRCSLPLVVLLSLAAHHPCHCHFFALAITLCCYHLNFLNLYKLTSCEGSRAWSLHHTTNRL